VARSANKIQKVGEGTEIGKGQEGVANLPDSVESAGRRDPVPVPAFVPQIGSGPYTELLAEVSACGPGNYRRASGCYRGRAWS
jgi:hypothetical protein